MKIVRIFSAVVGLVILAAWGINMMTARAGNKLIEEANVASQEANKATAEAAGLYKGLINDETVKGLPGNRSQIKPRVDQAAGLFEKSAAQFRNSAQKLDEASGKPVDKEVVEYWKLLAEAARKRAEQKDALRKIVLLLVDETVVDTDTFNAKAAPLVEVTTKTDKEYDDIEAKAKKLQAENPKKIDQTK